MALLSSLSILFTRLRNGVLHRAYSSLWQRLRNSVSFKFISVSALAFVLACNLVAQDVQAKRMGGGRSVGRQSHSIQQQHRGSMPPGQNQHAASRSQNTSTPAAGTQQPRNRWLGPLAGLAAGLGIAALMSHLGLGGALGGMLSNLLVIGLVILAIYWIIRLFKARNNNTNGHDTRHEYEPAFKPAFTQPQSVEPFTSPQTPPPAATVVPEASPTTIEMPRRLSHPDEAANFDSAAFLRTAKVHFIRLQTAWDAGDLNDIRKFTTAEMFAEIKLDLTERGATQNQTHVDELNAELLSIDPQSAESLASVRFSGLIRETEGQTTAEPFTEVWHFTKDATNNEWLLAGIQQIN